MYDSTVINCLQDFSTEIKSDMCKEQVCFAAVARGRAEGRWRERRWPLYMQL